MNHELKYHNAKPDPSTGYVCSQCGEKYFNEKEVEAIQNMIKALEEKLKDVLVAA